MQMILNLFPKNQESAANVPSLEKTIILLINTNDILKIQKNAPDVPTKEQHETIRVLGIMFNEDLKYAKQINWENILQKMENHINKLSPKRLSLNGNVLY